MTVRPQSDPLAAVIGRNTRSIRRMIGITQDGLARHARSVGLDWTETRVGHFEAARSVPTFATVFAVTLALQRALEDARQRHGTHVMNDVKLADLIHVRGGFVALTDEFDVAGAELADVCGGGTFTPDPKRYHHHPSQEHSSKLKTDVQVALQESGLTEKRLAKSLNVDPEKLAAESIRLWQSTFSEERDRRAGPGATQQKKGRITRDMRAELKKAIGNGDH